MPRAIENAILAIKPQAADWLSEEARKHYDKIMPLLIKDKVVCAVDVPIIEAACDCYARFIESDSFSDKKAAISLYERLMSSFGVTYKARKALALTKDDKKQEVDESIGDLFDD